MTHNDPTCFVHIGAPKTGSSALQRFFSRNRSRLKRYGLLYPSASLRGHGHHDIAFQLNGTYPEWATPSKHGLSLLLDAIADETADHKGDILLSSENFYLFPQPQALANALESSGILGARPIVILVYLRRQDLAHESWYNQTVKAQGYTHTFPECIDSFASLWDYDKQLKKWESAFGQDSVIVGIYDGLEESSVRLLKHALRVLGRPDADLLFPKERVNPGLNRDILEFQRERNTLPIPAAEKRRFNESLMALSQASRGNGQFDESSLLDDNQRCRLIERYRAGNHQVALRYFGRPDLFPHFTPPAEGRGAPNVAQVHVLAEETKELIQDWLESRCCD